MDITTPALVFPAISLLFIAYTNRLNSLSVLIRSMTKDGSKEAPSKQAKDQLEILQKRVTESTIKITKAKRHKEE